MRTNTVDTLGANALLDCIINRTITELVDSKLTKLGDAAFSGCTQLTKVDLLNVTEILLNSDAVFSNCENLSAIILRSGTMCTVNTKNAFSSSSTWHVYVPSALISQYQADSVWGETSCVFRAIEDYPDICG